MNNHSGRMMELAHAALHECNHYGCHQLTSERFCEKHKHNYDNSRDSASKRGYGRRWRISSKAFLVNHPFCVRCLAKGTYTPATIVDHIKPHKGNQTLFWDKNNWQPLCKLCHDKKTATEDGGFGR